MTGYIWAAAGVVSFLLLFCLDMAAAAFLGRSRSFGARFFRLGFSLVILALVVVPGVAFWLWGGTGSDGLWLLFHLVFFGVFCYYFGRRTGRDAGEARLRELMGLDSSGSVEEGMDRLFESRLRFPSRAEVVKSIGVLAKIEEAKRMNEEFRAVGRDVSADGADEKAERRDN